MSHSDSLATGPATPHNAEYSASSAVGLTTGMLSVVNMGEAPRRRTPPARAVGGALLQRHPPPVRAGFAERSHQLPPLAVLAADELVGLRTVRRLHLLGVPHQLLAGAERDVAQVVRFGQPAR